MMSVSRCLLLASITTAAAPLAACLTEAPTLADQESSILGGELAEVGDVPAMVMLVVRDTQLCTGTLIAPRWVLTAAHCVDSAEFDIEPTTETARQTTVAFDRMRLFSDAGFEVKGRRIVVHPDWDRNPLHGNDLALIELARAVDDRAPMPYNADGRRVGAGTEVAFIGYGRTRATDDTSIGTAYALTARTAVACANLGPGMPLGDDDLMCFDQHDGKGICSGDSGGPVIAELDGVPTLVGVNSFAFNTVNQVLCTEYSAATRSDANAALIAGVLDGSIAPEEEDDGGCSAAGAGAGGGEAWLLGLGGAALLVGRRRRQPPSRRA